MANLEVHGGGCEVVKSGNFLTAEYPFEMLTIFFEVFVVNLLGPEIVKHLYRRRPRLRFQERMLFPEYAPITREIRLDRRIPEEEPVTIGRHNRIIGARLTPDKEYSNLYCFDRVGT